MSRRLDEAIDFRLRELFASVLHDRGERLYLEEVRVSHDVAFMRLRVEALFSDTVAGQRLSQSAEIYERELFAGLPSPRVIYEHAHDLWNRMVEDHIMHRSMREREAAMRVLGMLAPDTRAYEQAQASVSVLREHMARHHAPDRVFFPVMRESPGVEWRRLEAVERAAQFLERESERMARDLLHQSTTTEAAQTESQAISVEDLRLAFQILTRNDEPGSQGNPHRRPGMEYQGMHGGMRLAQWFDQYYRTHFAGVGTPEAQAKGKALLIEHLTPDQRRDYEQHGYFHVTGNATGRTYRIKEGRQMNIDVLDKIGRRRSGICFLPEGQLVNGDCMLAQKIALETMEDEALKIANKFD